MTEDERIRRELAAAGYIGRFGLIVISTLMGSFGAFLGYYLFRPILASMLGEGWSLFNVVAGTALGAFMGVGKAVSDVERGNLKERALVNNANWQNAPNGR